MASPPSPVLLSMARRWAPAAFLTALLLTLGSYELFRYESARIADERYEALASIAHIKASQIDHWRRDQLESVQRMANRPLFREALAEWRNTRYAPEARGVWSRRLEYERRPEVTDALLLTLDGALLAASDGRAGVSDETGRLAAIVARSGAAAMSEPFRTSQGSLYIDVAALVRDLAGAPMSILVLRINPGEFLFPLIDLWPTPSASAETMLVRREGDEVVFVSPLRRWHGRSLGRRLPLNGSTSPAVQAVLGGKGRLEGTDYTGAEVLADARRIGDSGWFMVAKVDRSEITEAARARTLLVGVFVALIMVVAGGATAFVHHRRQTRLYRKLYLAEKEQKEAREQFRTILYSIGDAVITTDEQGRVEVMNSVAARLTGWSEDEARGRPLEEVFVSVDSTTRARAPSPAHDVLRGVRGVKLESDAVLLARGGGERPIADSAAPIRSGSGEICGMVLVFRDRSEERAAEQALRESESRFRQLADALPLLVWTAKPDGTVDFYNIRHREYEGIHRTAGGFEWEPVVHPDEREATVRAWTHARETGEPYEMEHRIKRADGAFRWLLSRGVPVRDSSGRVTKWFGTATDIDDLKAAQKALTASEGRYRALFENMNEGFAVGEPIRDGSGRAVSFRLVKINKAFERETGLPASILGRPIGEVAPQIESIWVQTFAEVAAAGRPVSFTEFNRDTHRYYEVYCFRPEDGRFSVLFRNVTSRVRGDAELKRTLAELKRSNADLEQFAFAASHDLKSPLRAIESLAQWLDEDLHDRIDAEHQQHLRLLRQRARRMARLLDDLLTYARAGSSGSVEDVDVRQLLTQIRDFLAPPEGMEIQLIEPLPVMTTPVAPLRQVFTNLLGNAIKHHDRTTGRITVSAKPVDGFVEFRVEDDGPGVPLEFRKRVFDMFQTLRPRDEIDGSGMGLAIVRRTVEALGGSVDLTPAGSGRGTVVRFLWPMQPATADIAAAPAASPVSRRGEPESRPMDLRDVRL